MVIGTKVNQSSPGPQHDEAADYTGVNHEYYHSQSSYRLLIHVSTAIRKENSTKYHTALPTSSCRSGRTARSDMVVDTGTRGIYSLQQI